MNDEPHKTLPQELQNIILDDDLSIKYKYLFTINGIKYNRNIFINKKNDFYTKRFTIAHEIGHHTLGHKFNGLFSEKEANNFALEKLLPQNELIKVCKEQNWDLSIVEKIFGVDQEKIKIRINKLIKDGIITNEVIGML